MSSPNVGSPIGGFPDGQGGSSENTELPCVGGLTNTQLIDSALAPARMKSDNQEVDERSASDLIALDKYIAARRAVCANPGNPFVGLSFGLAVPPSARGRQ